MHPEVKEEGLSFFMTIFDEFHGMLGIFMHGHLLAGTVKRPGPIVAVDLRQRRIGNHIVRQMPLPIVRRAVSRFLQKAGHQRGLGIEPIRHPPLGIARHPSKVAIDIVARWKVPRHHRGATRRTHSTRHREAMKVRPLLCKTINIRRFNIRMPVAAKISPTPIISKDEHDIRRSGSSLGDGKEG